MYKLSAADLFFHSLIFCLASIYTVQKVILETMHFILLIVIALVCLDGFESYSPLIQDSNLGAGVPNVRIMGGSTADLATKPAVAGEFPSMALLRLVNGNICGGTLIGPSHVLTAAHCLAEPNRLAPSQVSAFTVYVNTLSINGGGPGSATRGVSKFIVHPSYNANNRDNDIAMLVLSSPVTTVTPVTFPTDFSAISSTVKPTTKTTTKKPTTTTKKTTRTCKPGKPGCFSIEPLERFVRGYSTYYLSPAIITGWGRTSSGGYSNVLLKANVTINDNSLCDKYTNNPEPIAADKMCSIGPPAIRFLQGDGGGPIFVNGVQVGIISVGYTNFRDRLNRNGPPPPPPLAFTGVYTRITSYLGWIATTKANNPPPIVG